MGQVTERDQRRSLFSLFGRRQEPDVPLETETSAVCDTRVRGGEHGSSGPDLSCPDREDYRRMSVAFGWQDKDKKSSPLMEEKKRKTKTCREKKGGP